jgi:hypothetical protein
VPRDWVWITRISSLKELVEHRPSGRLLEALPPVVVAARRDPEDPAQDGDRVVGLLRLDEGESQREL